MDEQQQQMGRIIAKAWADEAFKAALIADPVATLKAEGLPVPDGLKLSVVENSATHLHIVLPPKPSEGEMSDEALGSVSGGYGFSNNIGCGCCSYITKEYTFSR